MYHDDGDVTTSMGIVMIMVTMMGIQAIINGNTFKCDVACASLVPHEENIKALIDDDDFTSEYFELTRSLSEVEQERLELAQRDLDENVALQRATKKAELELKKQKKAEAAAAAAAAKGRGKNKGKQNAEHEADVRKKGGRPKAKAKANTTNTQGVPDEEPDSDPDLIKKIPTRVAELPPPGRGRSSLTC